MPDAADLINQSNTKTNEMEFANTETPAMSLGDQASQLDDNATGSFLDFNNRLLTFIDGFAAVSPYDDVVGEESPLELCGYPVFMDPQDCDSNSSISSCINYGKATVFGMVITILGVSIIAVNVLIPVLGFINKNLRTQHYYIKGSLAVADSIVGFLLTFSVLPNLVWVTRVTKKDLVYYPDEDKNSPRAVTVGALLTVSITASLLHLAFLSYERFTAIKWPFRHMRRKTRSVIVTIVCLWAIPLAASFVPAAFPEYFAYQFQPTILIHMMTIQRVNGTMSEWRGILYGAATIILPYIIMTALCLMTAIETRHKIQKSRKRLNREKKTSLSNTTSVKKADPDIFVFITVGMMIVAFTLTFLPFTIVMILFVTDVLDCQNYTVPYVLLFYVGLLNGLTNFMIYSVRDQRFRQAAKDLFPCSMPHKKGTVVTHSQSISLTKH